MQKLPKALPKVKDCRRFVSQSKIARIFLIARKQLLTEIIEIELIHQGYQVEVFHDGLTAAIAIRQQEPDLIVLDWVVSFLSGIDIYYCLRSTSNYIPIIALTEGKSAKERVTILNAGADDCLSHPFSMAEFLAIVGARLRQNRREKSHILIFEDLELNTLTREVHRNNRSIILTAKEFNLLEYLMIHPRQVLTRVQILEKIWGYDFFGDSNIIEVYIRYLRIKLEAQHEKRLIHTVRSVGYVLRSN
ncbi:response regulator transcription factor [Pleurocapsa sp. PCC 7319]|uniref:response regulator transcription factor n=1 Tax=Pleurocapsa sp. PCC 7319 TaxID=118161 RepID=UPI0003817C79|nr:response regulator transcription factor [Pleurocapsa sp. PCC 7319]